MAGMKMTKKSFIGRRGKSYHGFTMVELIVVIAILAILAAVGVATAIGYVNRTKFDQNSQNAITVYQTAQAALSQKSMNGTIDSWVQGLSTVKGKQIFDQDLEKKLKENEEADHSISKSVELTYNPKSSESAEDAYLYSLLSGYFYDIGVFNGTISLELNITATYGNGKINYSARVLSAFYSKENGSDSGWDNVRIGAGYIPNDPEFGKLPQAKGDEGYQYRRTTSYVGWFNGTSESITAPVGVVPVFLPPSQIEPLEGHIVAGDETGYLFNLRNGETLDVAWAIFDSDGQEHKDHNENITIILNSASFGNDTSDTGFYDGIRLEIEKEELDAFLANVSPETTITKENINNIYDVTRTSQDGFVKVKVIRTDSGSDVSLGKQIFPLTITKVEGDGRKGTSRDKDGNIAPYYEFRLSLDCMMVRSDEGSDAGWSHYGIDRMFGHTQESGINKLNPRNIYAAMYGEWTYTNESGNSVSFSVSPSTPTLAARAMDDPVYYTSTKRVNTDLTYFYNVEFNSGKGRFDSDDAMDDVNNKVLTGRCVVNTLFGDLNYDGGKDKTSIDAIGGTFWNSTGGNAVITSYRHLYNVRKIYSSKTATFRIVSNLDWYVHDKVPINGTETNLCVSEVKVFSRNTEGYKSPVMSKELKIVSFPAFNELPAKHTLTSMSKANGTIYSINNVQMRAAAFRSVDAAYGLICKNSGTVFNIYSNNLNLVLVNKADGTDSDYASICPDSTVTYNTGANNPVVKDVGKPIGGLIGTNSAQIGKPDINDDSVNTIRMSNSIVMSGSYWNTNKLCNEVGGIIGAYTAGSSSGVIEIRGSFAVVSGGKNTAGIIGDAKVDIGARLVVDGNASKKAPSEFDLPVNSVTGKKMSCVVAGRGNVAGAVAWFEKHELTYEPSKVIDSDDLTINETTGKIYFPDLDADAYQIDVNLPDNSLIIKNGTYDGSSPSRPIGGAFGRWTECNGEYASIRVVNNGYIIATDTSKYVYCGGAIGREDNSTISTVYVNVENGQDSRIGNLSDTTGPASTGGAYGRIEGTRNGTIIINAENDGVIVSRGSDDGFGTGGAIGGVYSNVNADFYINVINDSHSHIICTGTASAKYNGAGGAIGGITNNGTSVSRNSIICAQTYGTISGKYNVGGTIGSAPANAGKIYSSVYGSVNGNNGYVGGAVGRVTEDHTGIIQAVLDGASVYGANFVGGAAGRVNDFRNDTDGNAVVKTVVQGTSEVNGTGSLVGGVVGDILIQGNGTNGNLELKGDGTDPVLTVSAGSDGVGGVAGLMRSNSANYTRVITPDQSATNKLAIRVSGRTFVGGAIGKLRSTSNNTTDAPKLLNNDATGNNIFVIISLVLNPQSSIIGTGDNVGGAVGCIDTDSAAFSGYISVSSSVGSANGGAIIEGALNVGGAVGQFYKTFPSDVSDRIASISVDFSSAAWTITSTKSAGTDANVGGAVGFFNSNSEVSNNTKYTPTGKAGTLFPISVNLGSSSVESEGNNVGGAIGKNLIKNGLIDVTLNGSVSGGLNVGGAIGVNRAEVNSVNVNILGNGWVSGNNTASIDPESIDDCTGTNINTGSNTGGAIGYNYSPVTDSIVVVMNGKVTGAGGNVGGAIGFCFAKQNELNWINSIQVTLQGNARVEGDGACVGGALGYTLGDINTVKAVISGNSKIKGDTKVGGAIGFATSAKNVPGASVTTQGPGIIKKAEVVISADEALEGGSRIGGVVGEAGFKKYVGTADNYTAPRFETIRAEINASKLFDTDNTGVDKDEEAMIGGVVGRYCDGTCNEIILGGTGGVVELNDDNMNYPKRTYDHAILIQANGRSVGGIVGLIGTDQFHQNVFLSNISVEKNGPNLCVVSGNGADKIGGWIGSGNGVGGGLGYRYESDWNKKHATYEVNTVKVVYSDGNYVGGLIGYLDCIGRVDSNNPEKYSNYAGIHTWADVMVNLDGATIMGKSAVGGAVGGLGYCQWLKGKLEVNYSNYTNVGDIGNPLPGDDTEYTRICYEAGGAIGYAYAMSSRQGNITIPITVNIDETSCCCGLAEQETEEYKFDDFGVGGFVGRIDQYNIKDSSSVHVTTDPSVVSVYSANTNVGGFAGVMISGTVAYSKVPHTVDFFSTDANVRTNGKTSCAGGFVGRLDGGTIKHSLASGKVVSNGIESKSGGFVGSISGVGDIAIDSCFTTAIVESKGLYTGGFVGVVEGNNKTKNIQNSYVGGHTYDGQYVANEGNISGVSNVGGFIGANTSQGGMTITNCYTTASVLGTGNNIGGFIGSLPNTGKLQTCYSAGRVDGPDVDTVGAFAGYLAEINNTRFATDTKCKSLSGINGGELRLVGTIGGEIKSNTDVETWIIFDSERGIRERDNLYEGHPIDDALMTDSVTRIGNFPLKAVINTVHYGDWPLPVSDRTSIANAEIIWDQEKVQFDENGIPFFVYGSDVSAETIKNLFSVKVEGNTLDRNEDYTLKIENNVNVGTASIIISGKNTYVGSVKTTFAIVSADISDAIVEIDPDQYPYTGAPVVPTLSVSINVVGADGQITNVPLVATKDYYLTYEHLTLGDTSNTNPGDVKVTVHGTGNYTGVADKPEQVRTFKIKALDLGDAAVTVINEENCIYNGSPIEPEVLVRLNNKNLVINIDYTVTYDNNTEAGVNTAKVIIQHVEGSNYEGSNDKLFTIKPATNGWIEEPDIDNWTYGEPADPHGEHFDGTALAVKYYIDSACTTLTTEANSGTKDGDGGKPVNVGTYYMEAKAVLTANGNSNEEEGQYFYNHSDDLAEVVVKFTITSADIASANVTCKPVYAWTGTEIKPDDEIVVTYGDDSEAQTLVLGTDYRIIYPENVTDEGTVNFTIEGIGNFTGTNTSGTYDIQRFRTVTFKLVDDQGNVTLIDTKDVKDGECVSPQDINTPEAPEGFVLDGWYIDETCKQQFDFAIPVSSDNVIIYAKWKEDDSGNDGENDNGNDSGDENSENEP